MFMKLIIKGIRMFLNSFRDAIHNVYRNFHLSVGAISTIIVTLLIIGVSGALSLNVYNFTENLKKDVTMIVMLEKSITKEEITNLENTIREMENIDSVVLHTKEEIAKEMSETSDVFKELFNRWGEERNPLHDEFLIKVKDIKKIAKTAEKIGTLDNIYNIKYGETMIKNMLKVFDIIQFVSTIFIVGLIVVCAFLISNTIKLAIFSRRNEIGIMRLVGASNTYIKMPFLIEGVLLGMLGSIIPILFLIYGYRYLYEILGGQLFSSFIKLIAPGKPIMLIALVLLAIGVTVGMFGSTKAVRKHLKP